MRLPSSATGVPILTTCVPFVDHTCPFAGHARLFVWRSVPGCSNSESAARKRPDAAESATRQPAVAATQHWQSSRPGDNPASAVSATWRQPDVARLRQCDASNSAGIPDLKPPMPPSMTDASDAFPPTYRAQTCYGTSVRRTTLAQPLPPTQLSDTSRRMSGLAARLRLSLTFLIRTFGAPTLITRFLPLALYPPFAPEIQTSRGRSNSRGRIMPY